ncbi:sialidase-4 isoform X2 [Nannospalax galili]|uniref:Sialidase-4 n=2 Tax=Nannospalax galili TaxID=1026970 RepID=A0A8C6RD40_NANGA|nr:sialidase-4 isoform X2 [Nannospalax galili]XP_008827390.1 sialidase-4 isoform X2 [Nannospalax galili]
MATRRVPKRTVLFQRERTGLTYRVPALLRVPPGPILLAFAEQRISPDDSHAHRLVVRRGMLAGGSVRWGALRVLETAALEEHRSMNPCPVLDADSGTIFLFFIAVLGHTPEAVQIATGKNAARLCCVTSRDAGLTWGSVRDLTEEAIGAALRDWATFAVGPGHGVQLRSGRLLIPAYTYHVDRRECFGKVCWTSPHSLAFYSDDHGSSWHCGGLVPNLRSGECQLAAVDGGFLYCNARSPLGNRVQALSANEGTSFLPGELVPTLAETARGCQGSIVGFPAPPSSRPQDKCWSLSPGNTSHFQHLYPRLQESLGEGAGGPGMGWVPRGPFCYPQPWEDGLEEHGVEQGPSGDRITWTPTLPVSSSALPQRSTWLLYSHPAGHRARLRMGIYLSQYPLDPHSWTEPWVIYEGPSGYSDLASLGPVPGAALAFACLFESGARASYEDISFCMFSLREVLENVPTSLELHSSRNKPQGHCWPS